MVDEACKTIPTASNSSSIKELCERKQNMKLQQYLFLNLRKILEFHA
ncbi:1003_t:CDS:2 [Diversispora eburnea]|uniref:1003_t:CDS:1 n=1 Tax=Diversispora eburnea TaxID=1213867 RepID=A0A9N9AF41_9GLOM|nr:1003_t:CDS:2 [Diversispora eburnea]